MNTILGWIGFAGGLLCAVADIFFDLKGKGNRKLGKAKLMDSNWDNMSRWRFNLSILLASVGVPLYYMGFLGMTNTLIAVDQTLGRAFFLFATIGSCGGLFIHVTICLVPVIMKTLGDSVDFEMKDRLTNQIFRAIKVPFVAMFCCLVVFTSAILIYAIAAGVIVLPFYFVFLTPLALLLIGWVFRLIHKEIFSDLPGIIMPSMGIAMIGLMTVLCN